MINFDTLKNVICWITEDLAISQFNTPTNVKFVNICIMGGYPFHPSLIIVLTLTALARDDFEQETQYFIYPLQEIIYLQIYIFLTF